ncbi:MAG: thioredoxin family protein [Salinivirgaceae bacterium]|jgi:thioredoxin-related protein|nr:thioredoxin family protein [Salinivirgaceae bacterium]
MILQAKNFKLFILLIALGLISFASSAQKINWLSFEEAEAKNKVEPRKMIVDLYTDWCKWCKVMDENTFAHPVIAEYINENFYAVKFNAESTDPVKFAGHTFENTQEGRRSAHDIAIALTQGKLSYPTYVFIDEKSQIIHVQPGYIEPKKFEPMIAYINKEMYAKGTEFQKFVNSFDSQIE